jgi:predicted nucleic acid-binding protein
MRVMLDTNILISGMIFQGSERRLLGAILKNNHVLVL